MKIHNDLETLLKAGNEDNIKKYLDDLPEIISGLKDVLFAAYALHRINKVSDAIKVLSKFQADEITMIAIFHQRGIYNLEVGDIALAEDDFQKVIQFEAKHNLNYCTPEAKFFYTMCHIKKRSGKAVFLADKLDKDFQIFYKNKLLNKKDIIVLARDTIY